MRFLKLLLACLVFLFLFIALWQNIPSILEKDIIFRLNLYWVQWESAPIPIYLITPLCFFAGLALMGIVDIGTIFRLRRRVKRLEKELTSVYPPEKRSVSEISNQGLTASHNSWDTHKEVKRAEDTLS